MELDIRQNNELIMDINSDKERVTVDLADSDVGDSKLATIRPTFVTNIDVTVDLGSTYLLVGSAIATCAYHESVRLSRCNRLVTG